MIHLYSKINKLSIELDKNTNPRVLMSIIRNFKNIFDDRYEVDMQLIFTFKCLKFTLSKKRKPYLKLIKN